MKVVLFCGGLGTRLRTATTDEPKPMTRIGFRPLLWHLMKYYAHFGHREFILCLGYRADVIKQYFLEYEETSSNDFVLRRGGKDITLLSRDIDDWRITFVDTGLHANIGERLWAVRHLVEPDEWFLANYADGLTDLDLAAHVDAATATPAVATFLSVPAQGRLHRVVAETDGRVRDLRPLGDADLWINAGYFVLRSDIFAHMQPGEELVEQPFQRLVARRQLRAARHEGFWRPLDTFHDHRELRQRYERGDAPWEVWRRAEPGVSTRTIPGHSARRFITSGDAPDR